MKSEASKPASELRRLFGNWMAKIVGDPSFREWRRRKLLGQGDPTVLAYVFYGDTRFRMVK